MKDAERIAELEAALRRSELLVEQLQAQLNLRRKQRPPAGQRAQGAVQEQYPHGHSLHRAVFMARESYAGGETFEDGVRGLIAELKDTRKAQGEWQRLRDWVACVERLPADKRDVMVYCADSDEHMVGSSIGDGLFLFATSRNGEKVVCRPTHWRYIDESDKPDLAASTGQEPGKQERNQ